ncbi:MAG: RDD family protein [Actinobacteria bacterium]|nr:MAG: RDD family protein [Actinomycetota bacterium]
MTQPPPGYPPQGYPPPAGYRPAPVAPNGAPLADFGQRLLAYVIDTLILSAVLLIPIIVILAVFIPMIIHATGNAPAGEVNVGPIIGAYLLTIFVLIVLSFALRYLYLVVYLVGHGGQTIGKRAMKIRVVRLADGGPVDASLATRRWLVEVGCGLIGVVALLDGLWQLWDQPYRQCLHDKWPQTVVVKVPA